jgi:uncharacterized protein (TIGR00369 family)
MSESTGPGPTGLQQMEAIRDGRIPRATIQDALAFDLLEVEAGRAVFGYAPSAAHCNPMGQVHGGVAMTLLDSAAGCCVHTTLEPGQRYATLETKVNLVRVVRADGPPLRAEGRVVHRGGTVATSEARLVDADGRLYAHATSTCLIMGG